MSAYEPIEVLVAKLGDTFDLAERRRCSDEIISRFQHMVDECERLRRSKSCEGMKPHDPFPGPSEEERRRVWADAWIESRSRAHEGKSSRLLWCDADIALEAFDARFPQGGTR